MPGRKQRHRSASLLISFSVTAKLISACFHYTDSTIPLLLKYKISSLKPSSETVQAGLCRTWSEPKLLVCHAQAQLLFSSVQSSPLLGQYFLCQSCAGGYKTFFMLNPAEHKILTAHKSLNGSDLLIGDRSPKPEIYPTNKC